MRKRRKKIDDHNGLHAVAPWRWEGEEVGEGGVWSSCYVFLLSAAQAADPKKCDLPPAQAGSHFEGSAAWAGARKIGESAAPLQTPELRSN